VATILIATFAAPQTAGNTFFNRGISILGLAAFYFILWITSANRKLIRWDAVITGVFFQFILALFVLRTSVGYNIFGFISQLAR
jgi:concentrative nucleoside transporter, CNT family